MLFWVAAGSTAAQDSIPTVPSTYPTAAPPVSTPAIPTVPTMPSTPNITGTFCVEVQSLLTAKMLRKISTTCGSLPFMQQLRVTLPSRAETRMVIEGELQHAQALVEVLSKLPLMLGKLQKCELNNR